MKQKVFLCLMVLLLLISPVSVLAGPEQPLLQVSAVSFSPETVAPGKEFVMSVTISNHGEYNAYNITLDVASLAGSEDLGIFSMVGNGNQFFVEEIDSGETTTIDIPMVSDPSAEAKNYNINLNIKYESWGETEYTSAATVGVFLNEADSMSIISSEQFTVDNEADEISLEIANYGSNPVKGVQLSIAGDNLTFGTGFQYFGTFEKDDYDDFSTSVTADAAGSYPAKITLKYMDSFNNERVIERDITINIPDSATSSEANEDDENPFTRFFKALFGISA
ncbi:MAG: hypothetical protein PWP16_218 [Eubacteriaceae bacterium]|jgi:hypothetical protein|nr:hypothetical protein [Eubacteriaceae bacterium]MDN5306855.1 hypothetical protein [Eubacteriaceae bacterium]